MVATDAFVYFSKYVVDIFLSYAFEEGCKKNLVYKGVPRKRASLADLALSLDASIGSLGNVPFNK